jgi:predicted DNA-binding protein (MmcQ/YjbR family)
MNDERYRKLALSLPEAEEKSHFGKPDFRVRNKIFAGFTDKGRAYVKLTPEQQGILVGAESKLVSPIPGGWGKKGWTLVDHENADGALLRSVLAMAYKNVAPKKLQDFV